jgi:hypothetical protein
MAGTGDDKKDVQNWIYWQWTGTVALTSIWPDLGQSGDWAEPYGNGNWGTNVSGAIRDLANDYGFSTPLSGPPNYWGKAIDRQVFLWGPSAADYHSAGNETTNTAQQYNKNNTKSWSYMTVREGTQGQSINRVRFTRSVVVRFYANLAQGSSARSLVLTQEVPGPVGTCTAGWGPGGGVYTRQIDPNS